jgi:hypothetical protein
MPVVMGGVLVQDHTQVPQPGDQHPVGDLNPDGPHPPLGKGVRPRTARWDLHHLDTGSRQHCVQPVGDWSAQSRTMKWNLPARSPKSNGGCPARSPRTRRDVAGSPCSRRGTSRMPAWSRPGCARTAAAWTRSGPARAVSAAASAPFAPWMPDPVGRQAYSQVSNLCPILEHHSLSSIARTGSSSSPAGTLSRPTPR